MGSQCVGGITARRIGSKQVAKRKDSIALFEVIKNRRSDANLTVPPWMGAKGTAGAQEPPLPTAQPAAPGAASTAWSRLSSGAGGQLTLKLTYTHCLVAAVVLALVAIVSVWAAYQLGAGSRPAPKPAAGVTLAEKVPPGPHVVTGNNAAKPSAPAVAPGPAAASSRVPGKYYLVIQSMVGATKADQVEAEQIRTWCAQHGEPATVATYRLSRTGKELCIVWSLRPFNSSSSPEAQEFGKHIETLGKLYNAQYKRYDFRQRRDGKFEPWFEICRAQPAKK